MVENFTKTEKQTYTNEKDIISQNEETFEAKIKDEMKSLLVEPPQSTIENILHYSKTFGKK